MYHDLYVESEEGNLTEASSRTVITRLRSKLGGWGNVGQNLQNLN